MMKIKILILLLLLSLTPGVANVVKSLQLRPDQPGLPTRVHIALYILNIEKIDNIEQNFTIDFALRLKWKIPNIGSSREIIPLTELWHPNIQIYNQRDLDKLLPESVKILPGDTVRYTQRYRGELSSFLDFHSFPFDKQKLTLTLLSFGYTPEEVNLVFESVGSADKYSISGWEVKLGQAEVSTLNAEFIQGSNQTVVLPRFEYYLEAERHINFYWWKIVAPLAIIVFLSWAVFWIDPTQIGPQLGLSATSILTLIAFLLRLEHLLPHVSYLTHMDYFIFSVLSLVFMAYLEALVGSTIALRGNKDFALKLDRWARGIFPTIFLLIIFYYWVV